MKKIVSREERLSKLDVALQAFHRHYKVPSKSLEILRVCLTAVPEEVTRREKRLLCGLPARPSDLPVPRFKDDLLSAIKDIGLWKRMPLKERDALRDALNKRLSRNYSSIPRSEGRQTYAYADLEKDYAYPIMVALEHSVKIRKLRERSGKTTGQSRNYTRPFPVSRSGENKELIGGPALELLLAALAHALPYSGAPGAAGAEKRLSGLKPSEKKRSDS